MTTDNVIQKRNEVLQFGMNHMNENNGILYLNNPFKHGTVEIYGCNVFGEIMGVENDGREVSVSYYDLGCSIWSKLFVDLYLKYCKHTH